jgi:class 3 adenylate cyclase
MIRIGDENWLELVRWHNWKVREAVVAYGGNEVKSQGDGFMLAFDRVDSSLDCMLSLLSTFSHPAGSWDPDQLSVRIGAHTGPTSRDLGDYYGTAVVIAARIAASAQGGQALVSEAIAKAAAGYEFGEPRQVPLKGLPGRHFVYPLLRRSPH